MVLQQQWDEDDGNASKAQEEEGERPVGQLNELANGYIDGQLK